MLINRKAIHENLREVDVSTKGNHFSEILDNLLLKESSVKFSLESNLVRNFEFESNSIYRQIEKNFENNSIEDLLEIDKSLIENFFDKTVKKNFHLIANSEVINDRETEYEVFGISCEESSKYYLITKNDDFELNSTNYTFNSCGLIVNNNHFLKLLNQSIEIEGYDYFGTFMNDGWIFYQSNSNRSSITVTNFDMFTRLFSRNVGLLESSVMNKKSALIVGCGSVGSLIALELARAGVGNFTLVDSDTLEIHNISRHQLGFRDLGRFKVDAVKDAIHNINPYAKVTCFKGLIQELPKDYLTEINDGIIIGTGDNRESSAVANELSEILNLPFVSTGCWQRAHAGECFYWYPNADLTTYRNAFINLITSERPESHKNYFADELGELNLRFEPGISTDIGFVTLIAIKIIYDLLNMSVENYTKRVIGYLTQYTLVCNTNEAVIGGSNAEYFPHPLFISNTISISKRKRSEL